MLIDCGLFQGAGTSADGKSEAERLAIVVASSMQVGGRIINYLKALLGDTRRNLLFVGYQAKGTPGCTHLQYGPGGGNVELDGAHQHPRQHETLGGYSAHANQKVLLNFGSRMRH